MRKIIFYRLNNGKCPIEDYLDSLSQKPPKKEIKKAEKRKKEYFLQRKQG
jgi:hypothetical protein